MALLPLMVFADIVTEKQAQVIAEQFFASATVKSSRSAVAPSLRMVYNGENRAARSATAPAYYVYNNEAGKGFVIVSGDDRTAQPVLGYALDQNFDGESMPVNLRTWMEGIRSEINGVRAYQSSTSAHPGWSTREYNDM